METAERIKRSSSWHLLVDSQPQPRLCMQPGMSLETSSSAAAQSPTDSSAVAPSPLLPPPLPKSKPAKAAANDPAALTIVIKLGTSSRSSQEQWPDTYAGSSSILHPEPPYFPQIATLSALVETCIALRSLGHRVVIVSSGAIGMGLHRMDLPALAGGKKRSMGEKQALAAIGQGRLIALWDQLFGMLKQPIAQILMTRNDIADVSGRCGRAGGGS